MLCTLYCLISIVQSYFDWRTLNLFSKLRIVISIIFHANENVLYNIESELYKNKSILLIGTGKIDKFIKKINLLKKLSSLKFKNLVCLATIKHKWANIFIDDWIIAEDTNLDEKEKTLNSIYHSQ